jgi:hydrogenase expression/formation protein HypC
MRIVEINGYNARCEAKGVERDINLFMMQHEHLVPGDYVLIHVGYAIQKIAPQDYRSTWELYDQMLAAENA